MEHVWIDGRTSQGSGGESGNPAYDEISKYVRPRPASTEYIV